MLDPLALVRGLHFAATLLTCGTVVFLVLVAEPAGGKLQGDFAALRHQLNVLTWLALGVAALSGAAWLALLASDILGASWPMSVCMAAPGRCCSTRVSDWCGAYGWRSRCCLAF